MKSQRVLYLFLVFCLTSCSTLHSNPAQTAEQPGPTASLESMVQVKEHESLARAYLAQNNYLESVKQRIVLEKILPNETDRQANRRQLWSTLNLLSLDNVSDAFLQARDNPELAGWLNLAMIYQELGEQQQGLTTALARWRSQYPAHPANALLPGNFSEIQLNQPKTIALLLPLTGPLADAGNSVRNGFMDAYYTKEKSQTDNTRVKVYDTNQGDIRQLYSQAVSNGADFVIGPLDKERVATLAESRVVSVPTIALNYLPDPNMNGGPRFYQFGLSPVDEAVQVALKARGAGHQKALIIAPNNAWSNTVVQAFTQEFQRSGGRVVTQITYANSNNLNELIRDSLLIPSSTQRAQVLKNSLRENFKFVPRRRQDVDMVFMLASPVMGRQIKPFLQFHYAGDLPVYSTSMIYTGQANRMKDTDLNDIQFPDIPWVLQQHKGTGGNARLYALGHDAFKLSQQITLLSNTPQMGLQGLTGELYLSGQNYISRQLRWATFQQGVPQLMKGHVA